MAGFIGCEAYPLGDDLLNAEQEVALYLFPPGNTSLPAQVIPNALLEADLAGLIKLDPGISVPGRVLYTFLNGEGLPQTQSILCDVTALSKESSLSYVAQSRVETVGGVENSYFDLFVPTGTYDIYVEPIDDQGTIPPQCFWDQYLSPRDDASLLELEVDPGYALTVTLQNAEGEPLVGLDVFVQDTETGLRTSALVEQSNGNYELIVTYAASHWTSQLWMMSVDESPVPVYSTQIDADLSDINDSPPEEPVVFIYDGHTVSLSGTVFDVFGSPIPEASVYATRNSAASEGAFYGQTTTDDAGRFSLPVPNGTYDLVFRPPSVLPELSGLKRSSITVENSLELDSISLPTVVNIDGRILDQNGIPIEGASLTFISEDRANTGSSTFSDANGRYNMGIGQGSYLLEIDPPVTSDHVRKVIALTIAQSSTIGDITLDSGFRSNLTFLSGDTPVSDLIVQAWEPEAVISDALSPANLITTAVTDTAGAVVLVLPFD